MLDALERGDGWSLRTVLVAVSNVLTYLGRSLGLIVGVACVVALFLLLGTLAAHWWPSVLCVGGDLSPLYLAEFGGILAFGAITVAIGIWKFSFAETRFAQQASDLRDKFLDLAYRIQDEQGAESNGTSALKGIGEALDVGVFVPARFNVDQMNAHLRVLLTQPEMAKVRPALLIATQNVVAPMKERRMWQAQVALALRYIVFCAFVLLCLALVVPLSNNRIVAWLSAFTVLIALQATLRFLSGSTQPPPKK